jgi:hypothetical protein
MTARHVPVMERLAVPALSASPDRDLLHAIRDWQTDSQGMGLLEYTGLRRSELAAICRDETPVAELIERRMGRPLVA